MNKMSRCTLIPFLFLLMTFTSNALSIYDIISSSSAKDNDLIFTIFFDLNFEDQVIVIKALAEREETIFQDIFFRILNQYTGKERFKREFLLMVFCETLLNLGNSALVENKIAGNRDFFDFLSRDFLSFHDSGLKGRIVKLMSRGLSDTDNQVVAGECNQILKDINSNNRTIEELSYELDALFDYIEQNQNRDYLFFCVEIIKKIKDRDLYQKVKNIIKDLVS